MHHRGGSPPQDANADGAPCEAAGPRRGRQASAAPGVRPQRSRRALPGRPRPPQIMRGAERKEATLDTSGRWPSRGTSSLQASCAREPLYRSSSATCERKGPRWANSAWFHWLRAVLVLDLVVFVALPATLVHRILHISCAAEHLFFQWRFFSSASSSASSSLPSFIVARHGAPQQRLWPSRAACRRRSQRCSPSILGNGRTGPDN